MKNNEHSFSFEEHLVYDVMTFRFKLEIIIFICVLEQCRDMDALVIVVKNIYSTTIPHVSVAPVHHRGPAVLGRGG